MNEITYQNKVALNENPEIADINKVTDDDMNEIKSVVNTNSQISSNNFGLGTDTWSSSATYSIGDIAVYKSNTYKNLTGTNTTTTPGQDNTNWEVMPLILNVYNTSTKNAYSSDYMNNHQTNAKILWANPNPTSEFTSQTITLSSSNYDYYEIISKVNDTLDYFVNQASIKGFGTRTQLATLGGFVFRNIGFADNTHLDVGNISGSDSGKSNKQLIPIYVIGYKTGLFS
jgi:hypothetical protein